MKKTDHVLGALPRIITFIKKQCFMASVKWSALVSEVKGVLNGSIFSVGYGGQTIRNRISGGGRKTNVWGYTKAALPSVSQTWRGLTTVQQTAWQVAAPDYPYTDKFGNSQIPSGYQLYCTLNLNLLYANQPLLLVPLAPLVPENIGTPSITNPSTGVLELNWTPQFTNRTVILAYCSQTVSLGKTSRPRTIQLVWFAESGDSSPVDFSFAYARRFGLVPSAGRVFWKIQQIDKDSGQRYGTFIGSLDLA
jgi:hypothetical protein